MTEAISSPSTPKPRSARRPAGSSTHSERGRRRSTQTTRHGHDRLVRYEDPPGAPREVVVRPGPAGSRLVIDRDATTLRDCRLLAHLGADEPSANAALVCSEYLAAREDSRAGCRELEKGDLESAPFPDLAPEPGEPADGAEAACAATDRHGYSYVLEALDGEMSIPILRWRRHPPQGTHGEPRELSLREVVGALESYAPVCELTERTLARHRHDGRVSTVTLAAELERVRLSPIVLNRLLRAAVLSAVEREDSSLSAIAIRCGRIKRDRNGSESGETSWLARRVGMLAEGGQRTPTPWVHTDVLALIARRGLGLSPREVELQ